jgi:hypothetical protein
VRGRLENWRVLRELDITHNKITLQSELDKLKVCPSLVDVHADPQDTTGFLAHLIREISSESPRPLPSPPHDTTQSHTSQQEVKQRVEKLNSELQKTRTAIKQLQKRMQHATRSDSAKDHHLAEDSATEYHVHRLRDRERRIMSKIEAGESLLLPSKPPASSLLKEYTDKVETFFASGFSPSTKLDLLLYQHRLIMSLSRNNPAVSVVEDREQLITLLADFANDLTIKQSAGGRST